AIVAAGGDDFAIIGLEGDAQNRSAMALGHLPRRLLGLVQIENSHTAVGAAEASQVAFAGRRGAGHGADRRTHTGDAPELLAGLGIPAAQRFIIAAGHDDRPLALADGYAIDGAEMPAEDQLRRLRPAGLDNRRHALLEFERFL